MSHATSTKIARRQSTAAGSSPLNQESTNVTHERLTTTTYDEQNGASAATIKRKAPPNTANPSTNNRDLDLANEMPFPTQPPNRAAAGPLALLLSDDRFAFGRETPPSQRRSPSPPFLGPPRVPPSSSAPYSHNPTSSSASNTNTPQGSPTNKNPLFNQTRSSQQQPSPPALTHSQSYRDVVPSSMPPRSFLAPSGAPQQRESPPALSQPPFSEVEDGEDDGMDVYVGKPPLHSHQSNNGNGGGGTYLHQLYPNVSANKGSAISKPSASLAINAQSTPTNQSLIDLLHIPPLPDTSDDLDSSSPSSSTPPAAAPPAPPPPPTFGNNSSTSYSMSGPRRQFFTQQTARPLSPLRHESFSASSAGLGGNGNNGNLVDPDTVVLPTQNSPGSKGRTVSGSGISGVRATGPGQNPSERKLPTPPIGTKTTSSSPTAPVVASNVNTAAGAHFIQGARVPVTTSSSPSSPPRIHGIQETAPDNTGVSTTTQRKGVLGPRASVATNTSPAEGASNPVRHSTSGTTSATQAASGNQPPDRSLPLREDDWNNRNSVGGAIPQATSTLSAASSLREGSQHPSRTPSPLAPAQHPQQLQQQQQPRQRSVTPTPQQPSPPTARRPMQYSPERLHAPRAVPLIDLDDFDQRHQQHSREAAAAYMARAPSALSMGYGMSGLAMPAYFYQQYYQPPMYNEFVSVPDYTQYYQSEEDHLATRDGDGSGAGRGRVGSPTPSSTLMHGLNLPEDDPTAKLQHFAAQQLQPQQQEQPQSEQQQKTQAQRDDRQRKRRSASQPRTTTAAPNDNGALPAYEDYRQALGEDRSQQRDQPSQEKRAQQHREGGARKEAEEELAHNTFRRAQAQDSQLQKEQLTRANVRANAGLPPHGSDLYDNYDPVQVQHAMWFLEQQRQRVLYQPHPQPLPAAFLDEYGPSRFVEEDAKAPVVEDTNGRHARQRQSEQPLPRQEDRQQPKRQGTNVTRSGNGQPDRPPSATSSHMYNNVRRPDAPIPPTPQSSTFFSSVAPTPYPLVFTPAPVPPLPASAIAATPAPGAQFASFVPRSRDFVEPALPTSTTAAAPPSPIQMQRYYPGGPRYYAPPPSIPSTAMSSPFVGPINPFIRSHSHLQADRESVVSSPSHHPLPLLPRRVKKAKKVSAAGTAPPAHGPATTTGAAATQRGPREPPARVASTLPPSSDTDPLNDVDDDDGDLTEGRDERFHNHSAPPLNRLNLAAALTPQQGRSSTDDDEESDLWIEDDNDGDSRLELETHPSYVSNSTKRSRRFQDKLGELIRMFNDMDRTTDATMLLFISQPDASPAGTYMLPSRNIRRSTKFMASATAARASFSQISASRRRVSRKKKIEAELRARQEELMSVTSSTTIAGDLSPTSSSAAVAHDVMRKNIAAIEAMAERAENQGGENVLKGALRATLESLRQMQKISEEREERRRDEVARQRREAAQMEELLATALSR